MLRRHSITRRLIASVLLIQVISALGVVGATLAYERHTRFQAFDVMLRGRADSLLGSVQDTDDAADDVMLDLANLKLPAEDVYEMQELPHPLLGRSTNWGGSSELQGAPMDQVFRTKLGGKDYRMIRVHGVRVVDPGSPGGGKVHRLMVVYGSPTAGVWREIREAVLFYAAACCVLFLLTGALVFWLLRRGLLPLRELADEAGELSVRRWSFHAPESARATEELAPLVVALEEAIKRLERSFVQQGRFVSDAAHELKTAVAVLKSSLQVMTMRPRSAPEYEAGLDRSFRDLQRMEETVTRMLMLARFEQRAESEAGSASADIGACLAEVVEQFQPMADLRQITVNVVAAATANVRLSREEAVLLCSNLLMNALQHGKECGRVELQLEQAGARELLLSVADDGEGIGSDVLPHVFERFYRGDASRVRKTGGTGLGLAICRAIVLRAGGTIALESVPGRGTKALVRLPRAEQPTTNRALAAVLAGTISSG